MFKRDSKLLGIALHRDPLKLGLNMFNIIINIINFIIFIVINIIHIIINKFEKHVINIEKNNYIFDLNGKLIIIIINYYY